MDDTNEKNRDASIIVSVVTRRLVDLYEISDKYETLFFNPVVVVLKKLPARAVGRSTFIRDETIWRTNTRENSQASSRRLVLTNKSKRRDAIAEKVYIKSKKEKIYYLAEKGEDGILELHTYLLSAHFLSLCLVLASPTRLLRIFEVLYLACLLRSRGVVIFTTDFDLPHARIRFE